MLKNVIRRTWSVLIALVMVWTTFCIGQPLMASATVTASTPSTLSGVKFVVPEAIYLKPVYNSYYAGSSTTTSSTFQLYVNNALDASGNVSTKTGEELQGDIYFKYSNATNAKLSYEWLNASGQATTGGTITIGGSALAVGYTKDISSSNTAVKISAGTSPSMAASATGVYIRWTVSYTDSSDGRAKTVQAYTYVYKPYVQPVGTAIKTINDRGSNHYGSNLSWISGVHDTAVVGDYYPNAGTSHGLLPFSNSDPTGTQAGDLYAQMADRFTHTGISNDGSQNWLNTSASPQYMPDKSFRHVTNDKTGHSSGDDAFNTLVYSPTAYMTIDVSRYSNLNQIPNLSLGLMVTDDESSDSGAAYFVSNYTGTPATADDVDYFKNRDHAQALWNQYNSDTIWSDGSPSNMSAGEGEGVKYNGKWRKDISGTGDTTYYAGTCYLNHQSGDTIWNISELRMKVTRYDKGSLRTAVNKAINNSATLQAAFYNVSSSAWTNYVNLYKAAAMALTKVDIGTTFSFTANGTTYSSPSSLANALSGAIDTLTGGSGRLENRKATQTNIVLRKTGDDSYVYAEFLNGTTTRTATFKSFDTVEFKADSVAGYSFIGMKKANSAPSNPTAGSSASYPTDFTTSDTGATISGGTVKYVHTDTTGTDNTGNIYYTYYYLANTYTVHFDANGGTGSMTDQAFTYNEAQELSTNRFERQGYSFNGWAKTSTGSATYTNNQSVNNLTTTQNGVVNLFATWKAVNYSILYDVAGGSISGDYTSTYKITDSVTLPSATRNGYALTGWRADDTGNWSTMTYTAGATVQAGKWGNVKLTAVWKSNNYSVAFNANGGTGTSMSNQSFVYGQAQALTANAYTRDGFTFRGWATTATAADPAYADKEVVQDLTSQNNAVVTLYAVWGAVNYTITYSTDTGTILDTVYTKNYTVADQIGLPTNVEKTGYEFAGWKPSSPVGTWQSIIYTGTLNAGMIGNVTLQAQWTKLEYTITYEFDSANGGQIVGTRYTTTYEITTAITLPSAKKVGYAFNGWVSDGSGNWGVSTYNAGNVSAGRYGDVTMTAQYTGNQYYVQFNGNGSTSGTMYNQTFTYGEQQALTANEYSRGGYVFAGWATSATASNANYPDQGMVANLSPTAGATVTLYAVWQKNTYTVTYDANGGSITTPGVTQYTITDVINLPVVSRNGYTLLGWRPTENNGSWHTWDTFTTSVSAGNYGSITLQAQWTKDSYTITYDAQGGTMSGTYTTEYDVDTQIVLPTVTRAGYNFNGWKADAAWNNVLITDGNAPTGAKGNVKLTAQWTQKIYYVRFNPNGGFGTMNNQLMRFDVTQNLTSNTFTRDGYIFDGWGMTATASTPAYYDGDPVLNLTQNDGGIVDLYALWSARSFKLAYNFNGATGSMFNTTGIKMDGAAVNLRPYNGEAEMLINDKRYAFTGWAYTKGAADNGIVAYADRASFQMNAAVLAQAEIDWNAATPTITLYAVWKELEIKLVVPEGQTTVIDPDRQFIYGLKGGITQEELVNSYLQVIGNGELEMDVGAVGTGTEVRLVNKDTHALLATYTIIIFGDVNGDGLINSTDYTKMRRIAAGLEEVSFNTPYGLAADLMADDDVNSTDLTYMRAVSAGLNEYDQANRCLVGSEN